MAGDAQKGIGGFLSHVFISYLTNEEEVARIFVEEFRAKGLTVFWAPDIPPKADWDQMIRDELDKAVSVVVLWSRASVKSIYVRDEADRARAKGKLFQVLMEDIPTQDFPIGFLREQSVRLYGWRGDRRNSRWQGLLAAIQAACSGALLQIGGVAELPSAVAPMPAHHAGDVFRDADASWSPEMVVIRAGGYQMGSKISEKERYSDEGPQHRVVLSKAFAVGKYPVTFTEWDAAVVAGGCAGHRPDDWGWGRGRLPVVNVNWDDAQSFCRFLSDQTGHQYRLLSESEWEYACRGGSATSYPWGDRWDNTRANGRGSGRGRTTEVGCYPPNEFGSCDMIGNVWE